MTATQRAEFADLQAQLKEVRESRENDLRRVRGRINLIIIFGLVPLMCSLVYLEYVEIGDAATILLSILVTYWLIYGVAYTVAFPLMVCAKLFQVYSFRIWCTLGFGIRRTWVKLHELGKWVRRLPKISLFARRSGNAT